jgi:hypothetical protein
MGETVISRNAQERRDAGEASTEGPGYGGEGMVVQLPGGEQINVEAVLEQAFGAEARGTWVEPTDQWDEKREQFVPSQRQFSIHRLYSESQVDRFTSEKTRPNVIGMVWDTEEESDRIPGNTALYVPNCPALVYVRVKNPAKGNPVALRVLYEVGEWRTPKGELIGTPLAHGIRRVLGFASVADAADDLERVRAAVKARMLGSQADDTEAEADVAAVEDVHESDDEGGLGDIEMA